ncbi:MAG: HupE/UreJ family protein [Pseudomonadota bacterium]
MIRLLLLALALCAGSVQAHENLPASLLLDERAPEQFTVRWRVPETQGRAPVIVPVLPAHCRALNAPQVSATPGASLLRWDVRCAGGLAAGAQFRFDGLASTMIDVLVRVGYADGSSVAAIARPAAPQASLPGRHETLPARGYFALGFEHIAGGLDHLLFVLCLVLLVPGRMALLKAITAFTAAHSVTLALAALGVLHVPQPPVEAMIALSIAFLARELVLASPGVMSTRPWALAFVFGLLHGFGFSSALSQVGLPDGDIALALLLFNLGVEAGQLVFVAAVVLALAMLARWRRAPLAMAAPAYAIGTLAAFWWLQRMAQVVGIDRV